VGGDRGAEVAPAGRGLGGDRLLEVALEDAQLAGRRPARAPRGGEAVPGPREGQEARAPAAAMGGQHRAVAAARLVGADDDVVLADALQHRLAGPQGQAVDRAAEVFDRGA